MARTPTTTEQKIWDSRAESVWVEVQVKDDAGDWVNLSDLEGYDFVERVMVTEDIDQPVAGAQVSLARAIELFRLSPLVASSKINNPAGGAQERLGINREICISIAYVPAGGGEPADADWRLIFHGDVVSIDISGCELFCTDLGGRLQRARMERPGHPPASFSDGDEVTNGGPYVTQADDEATGGIAAEDVMQDIIDDWGPAALTLDVPDPPDPPFMLTSEFAANMQTHASVLDMLRNIATRIGWEVRYVWDSSEANPIDAVNRQAGDFVLRFFEPDRTNAMPDITLAPSQYRTVPRLERNLAAIANRVEVFYWDAPSGGVLRSVIAEDAGSQAEHGVIYLPVGDQDTGGIYDETAADALAEAILHDVSDPTTDATVDADFLYHAELWDLIRFTSNEELWDSNQDLGTAGFRHEFENGRSRTVLTLRGTIAGHRPTYWLAWDEYGQPGQPDITTDPGDYGGLHRPEAPIVTSSDVLGGYQFQVTNAPNTYDRIEYHISTSGAAFTPDATTLVDSRRGTALSVANLAQGTTHHMKAVIVSRNGVRSPASTVVTFNPGTTIANKPHSDGMPYAITIDRPTTNYIENPSFEVDATGWSADDGGATGTQLTVARDDAFGLFGTCSLKATVGQIDFGGDTPGVNCDSEMPVAEDDEVVASIFVYRGSVVNEGLVLYIDGYDSSHAFVSSLAGVGFEVEAGEWTRFFVTATVPAGVDFVRMRLDMPFVSSGTEEIWFDGAQLEEGTLPSSFCDGTMGTDYAWSGTAHDSTSTRAGGFRTHGAMAPSEPSLVLWEDGTLEAEGITATTPSVRLRGNGSKGSLKIGGAGDEWPAAQGGHEDNQVFFRTDRGILYYFDGTRWLSVQEYAMPCHPVGSNPGWAGLTATNTTCFVATAPDAAGGTKIFITKWAVTWWVNSPNSGANDWTISLQDSVAGAIDSYTTDSLGADQWVHRADSLNAERTVGTDKLYRVGATKVGSPGTLFLSNPAIHYRLVG